jgi:hypothetical protein
MATTMTVIIVAVTGYLVLGLLALHAAGDPGGTLPRLVQWTCWPVAVPLSRRGSGRHVAPVRGPSAEAFLQPGAAIAADPAAGSGGGPGSAEGGRLPAGGTLQVSEQEDQGDLPIEDPPDAGLAAAWEDFIRRLGS